MDINRNRQNDMTEEGFNYVNVGPTKVGIGPTSDSPGNKNPNALDKGGVWQLWSEWGRTAAINQLSLQWGDVDEDLPGEQTNNWLHPWDGRLDDGSMADDAARMKGMMYEAPQLSERLGSSSKGGVFMHTGCDGQISLGWPGTALGLSARMAWLPKALDQWTQVGHCGVGTHTLPPTCPPCCCSQPAIQAVLLPGPRLHHHPSPLRLP